ncbi:transposable element Tcb2 transposase [Trichonephila clavipes]|nr:transposable element Tcb2 transposase [Trichonephila clavipes]
MTAQRYVHDILQPHVLPLMQRLRGAIFQTHNTRPHTARVSQDCLRTFPTLPWPAQSPDISPIEHIWHHLGRRAGHPTSLNELEARLQQVLNEMSQDVIHNLYASMPYHQRAHRAILEFADDIVLLAELPEELQEMIQATADELSLLCLHLSPAKCATLHIKGGTPVHAAPTKFILNNSELKALTDGEFYPYLGKPVGFFIQKTFGNANEALRLLHKISTSNLAQ